MKREKSVFFITTLIAYAISMLLFVLSFLSESIATALNNGISQRVRSAISSLFSIFKYSVFEGILIVAVPIILFLILYIIRGNNAKKRFLNSVSIILIASIIYILSIGIPHFSRPIYASRLIPPKHLTEEDFVISAEKLVEVIEKNASAADRSYTVFDIEKAIEKSICQKNNLPRLRPKYSAFPTLYTKLGIVSLYSFLTSEIIINTEIPEYMAPFVIAHEYTHLIGASSEADAEFMAYLLLSESENKFLNYSAALSALEYIYPYLKNEKKNELYLRLPSIALSDLMAHGEFSNKYSSVLSAVAKQSNGFHSEMYGGTEHYSFTSTLIVAHLTNK